MQSDCQAEKFDCSKGMRMMIFDHDNGLGLQPLFTLPDVRPGEPNKFAGSVGAAFPGNIAPMPTIFKEGYKELEGWKTYISAKENGGTAARYWNGTLTTVSNGWFNVVGGHKVKVVLFEPGQLQLTTEQMPDAGQGT